MTVSLLRGRKFLLTLAFALLAFCAAAHAQAGPCTDPWINGAFTTNMLRPPQGSGATGECNPARYEGGHWTDQNDLAIHVVHSTDCPDPWIGQIYFTAYGRRPTAAECNASNYGGGRWTNYGDLRSKINAYVSAQSAARNAPATTSSSTLVVLHLDRNFDLVAPNGQVVVKPGAYTLIGEDGSSLTQAQIAAIVAQGGGNIVAQGGGNIILNAGGNYRLASVSGRPVFISRRR